MNSDLVSGLFHFNSTNDLCITILMEKNPFKLCLLYTAASKIIIIQVFYELCSVMNLLLQLHGSTLALWKAQKSTEVCLFFKAKSTSHDLHFFPFSFCECKTFLSCRMYV